MGTKKKHKNSLQWATTLKYKYGLTKHDYELMLSFQNNKCLRCGSSNNGNFRFAIDHNHITGRIRGLVCNACNCIIGLTEANLISEDELTKEYLCFSWTGILSRTHVHKITEQNLRQYIDRKRLSESNEKLGVIDRGNALHGQARGTSQENTKR